jgi:hypothetical protein
MASFASDVNTFITNGLSAQSAEHIIFYIFRQVKQECSSRCAKIAGACGRACICPEFVYSFRTFSSTGMSTRVTPRNMGNMGSVHIPRPHILSACSIFFLYFCQQETDGGELVE